MKKTKRTDNYFIRNICDCVFGLLGLVLVEPQVRNL